MAKIRENEPLPPHTRLSYDECYAKLILEKIFPNRYENLQLSDKPDLRDLKHNIGIEVTSVIPKEEQEALNLAAMMPYVNEQSQERRRKRLKKIGYRYTKYGMAHPPESYRYDGDFNDVNIKDTPCKRFLEAYEEKIRKLNSGNYAELEGYDVSTPLQDKELHSLIDRLNPDLRAIDTFDGKTRTKEFYAMTKEDAYALLESIAKLSGTMDKLQRLTPEGHEIADEEVAAEIQEEAKERKAPFSFIKCGIPMGAEVVLQNHPEVVAVVKDDRQIEYQGKTYSLSALAQKIMQTTYPLQGPVHWLYQGRKLRDIRVEREEAGLYE